MMRTLIFKLLYHLGVGSLLHRFHIHHRRVPVLLFHRVSPVYDPLTQPLHPADFENILRMLLQKYTLKPLGELFDLAQAGRPHVCFITFDDATEDFLTYALPVLKKYDIPVTQFVPVAPALAQKPTWNIDFFSMIQYAASRQFSIELAGRSWAFDKDGMTDQAIFEQAMQVIHFLYQQRVAQRDSSLKKIKEQLKPAERWITNTIGLEKLKPLQKDQVSTGSHSLTHAYLTSLSPEELVSEFVRSKRYLQKAGLTAQYFAYPVGAFDDEVLALCEQYYQVGFTTGEQLVDTKRLKNEPGYPYQVPRITVYDSNPQELYLRINGFHRWLSQLKFWS